MNQKNKLYLGNLSWEATLDDVSDLLLDLDLAFHSVKIINDKETGNSRGFAFIECDEPSQVTEAIEELNGCVFMGRTLQAAPARERDRSDNQPSRANDRSEPRDERRFERRDDRRPRRQRNDSKAAW